MSLLRAGLCFSLTIGIGPPPVAASPGLTRSPPPWRAESGRGWLGRRQAQDSSLGHLKDRCGSQLGPFQKIPFHG